MWLRVSLPDFGVAAFSARVARIYPSEGAQLRRGDRLFDLTVDLSGGVTRDCPPISSCRIVLREDVWLRRLMVAPGEELGEPAVLALISTDPDGAEEPAMREARVTVATMLLPGDWWASGA